MMKYKNIVKIVLSLLCALVFAGCIAACTKTPEPAPEDPSYELTPGEQEYDYVYASQFDGPNDPEIVIDGKLDEEAWQNKKWYTSKFYTDLNDVMPMISVTAFNTEYGTYMGVKVRDDNIIYNGMLYLDKNSLIEFYYYADKTDTVAGDRDYSLRRAFMMDYAGELYSTGERMKRAITVDGKINSGNTVGATFEIFIPWSEMGIDVSDGAYPQVLYLLPTYRPILKGNSTHTPLFNVPFNPMNHIKDFYVFDANGYTDEDAEGAVVGDSINGTAKSACWDLERLDEGILSVTSGVEFNSIFFRDAFSENFIAETTIYPLGGSEEYAGWYGGFWLMSTNGNYYTMMMDMRESELTKAVDGGKAFKKYTLVTLTEAHTYWEQINKFVKENPAASGGKTPETSGVKFKILKDRNTVYYFVNDEYFYQETLDFVQGKVYAGLFNMNTFAEYRDFSYRALNEEETAKELGALDIYQVDVEVTTDGGYAETDKEHVLIGGSAEIRFFNESGYKLTSILCNGEDITETVKTKAEAGAYLIESVLEDLRIEVQFAQIEKPVAYRGFLKKGDEYAEGKIIVISKANRANRYEIEVAEDEGFEVLLEAREHEVFVDGYFGKTVLSLAEDLEKDIQLDEFVELKATDTHALNVDFIRQQANSVKGSQGEWLLLNDSSPTVYLSANIYNYDLDGFTIETDDGENIQLYLAYQGLYVFKNHDWITVPGVKYDDYSYFDSSTKSKVLDASKMDQLGGKLVEIAISKGVLYMTVDGLGKMKLPLSEFNKSFKADTKYRVGFMTYNANHTKYPASGAVYANISAAFGDQAEQKVKRIVSACTQQDFTLGEELYNNAFMSKVGGNRIIFSAKEAGAEIISGVEIEQGKPFMVYSVINKSTINGAGFVVGTLGEDRSKHLLFNWRQGTKDIYISRESTAKWGWKGIADGTYPCDQPMADQMRLTLVYTHGMYLFYVNDQLYMSVHENDDAGWGTVISKCIGTTGNKKIGLSALYGAVGISGYGYSTDENEINAYVRAIPLYKGFGKVTGNKLELRAPGIVSAFIMNGVEVDQGESFMATARLDSVNAENVGFVIGTLGDQDKNHVMFDWRNQGENKDIYIWRSEGTAWGWAGVEDGNLDLSCDAERKPCMLTLVYRFGKYYLFIDGSKVLEIKETQSFAWSTSTIKSLIGTSGKVKFGLTTSFGNATISDFSVTTDLEAIKQFVPDEEEVPVDDFGPVDGVIPIYDGAEISGSGNKLMINAGGGVGAFAFSDVEVDQDQNFMATVRLVDVSAENVGFVVGTLGETKKNHVMFDWRKRSDVNDLYIWRNGTSSWGWAGIDPSCGEEAYPDLSCSAARGSNELTLVYKDGKYHYFIDGNEVTIIEKTQGFSWTSATVESIIGMEGKVKIGLTTSFGSATFSDFAVTTDPDAINALVPDEGQGGEGGEEQGGEIHPGQGDDSEYTPWIKYGLYDGTEYTPWVH